MQTRAPKSCGAGESGQALSETLLMMMPLVMLIAAVFQVFLVDAHVFRLATRSHAEVFRQAFSYNAPLYSYDRSTARWGGSDQYVPVVGFFGPYGLTRQNMRIRTTRRIWRTGPKGIEIGRGTQASVAAGVGGAAAVLMNNVDSAMNAIDRANRLREDLESRRNRVAPR